MPGLCPPGGMAGSREGGIAVAGGRRGRGRGPCAEVVSRQYPAPAFRSVLRLVGGTLPTLTNNVEVTARRKHAYFQCIPGAVRGHAAGRRLREEPDGGEEGRGADREFPQGHRVRCAALRARRPEER